jgi:hypothetical protein
LPALVGSGVRGAGAGLGGFVGECWCAGYMPRRRDPDSPKVVYRTARAGLRVTRGQRRRLIGLLISAGDVRCCVLESNTWRRARQARPLASYPELCHELAASGPGTFGNSTPWARGRCCAATPMPGFRRPNGAAAETSPRGSRGGGGGWCHCAGITARSASTGGRFTSQHHQPTYGEVHTNSGPTRFRAPGRPRTTGERKVKLSGRLSGKSCSWAPGPAT